MPKSLDPTDVRLGAAVRKRRKAAHLSLEALGRKVGVTYQQVQKYESGANRVSFSMLLKLGGALPGGAAALFADAEDLATPASTETIRLSERLEQLPAAQRRALTEGFINIVERLVAGAAQPDWTPRSAIEQAMERVQ